MPRPGWLKRRQAGDGRWPLATLRPPIESNDIQVTAVSMRALQIFAPPAQRGEYARSVDRARAWLTTAEATVAEERAFRLMGLRWAGASTDVLSVAARDLLAIQHDDGGWAQLESMASDAYATGEALVALRESGVVAVGDRAYRKGLEYLLRTQIEDGSWIVETRSVPIQAYFESGFPYGVNQWVSAAATGWATTALALASETPQAPGAIPRPPAPPPGPARPEDGSAAPDGYAPIPAWLGQTRAPSPARSAEYTVETVAEGLNGAFSFNFLPDGRMIAAERPGHIRLIGTDGKVSESRRIAPRVSGPAGKVCSRCGPTAPLRRTGRSTSLIRSCRTEQISRLCRAVPACLLSRARNCRRMKRITEDVKVLLNGEGATLGRVIQAPNGTLLVTSSIPAGLGINSVDWPQPQALDSNMGKVLRINTDGTIPKDNPFVGRSGAHPEIYALGFRDIQGITIHPRTGKLWTSEHGPRGGDEINAVEKGKNYGFPVISYGREYGGSPSMATRPSRRAWSSRSTSGRPRSRRPEWPFTPESSSLRGRATSFVAELVGRCLVHLVINGERVTAEERLLTDLNARIRGVNQGPDGALYVLTDGNGGKILRLVPKKSAGR